MWIELVGGIAVALILSTVPGFFVTKAFGADNSTSLMCSPLIGVAAYSSLSVLYGVLGIVCNGITLVVPVFCAGILGGLFRRKKALNAVLQVDEMLNQMLGNFSYIGLSIIASLFVGTLITSMVFLNNIGMPDAIIQNYDNAYHLSRAHSFFSSENYSSFFKGLYPSAWHGLVAMLQSITQTSTATAENVICFIVPAIMYPLSMTLLLSTLFPQNPRKVLLGSLFCLSIAFFPWRIMLFGPLYPNLLSFSLMPAACALFIRIVSYEASLVDYLQAISLLVVGGAALVLAQPNGVFSSAVFLLPFLMYRVRQETAKRFSGSQIAPWIAEGASLLLFILIWTAILNSPAMNAVVNYKRAAPNDVVQSIKWLLALCFTARRQQYLLGLVVIVGFVRLLREAEWRWISISYAILSALFVVAHGISGQPKTVLTGFWYSDYYRLAAVVAIFATPLVAEGLDCLLCFAVRVKKQLVAGNVGKKAGGAITDSNSFFEVVILSFLIMLNYFALPFLPHDARTFAYAAVSDEFYTMYTSEEVAALDVEERAFLQDVGKIISEGERIANQPYDGSVFSYPLYDMDVLNPSFGDVSKPEIQLINEKLDKIATDSDVAQAVQLLHVGYVLQLDQSSGPKGINTESSVQDLSLGYNPEEWEGINHVNGETPGFKLIKSEGDMRLYKIDAVA